MTENAFIEKMVDLMDTEDELTMDTKLMDIEEWDSLSFVSFIAFANAQAGKKLTPDIVRSAKTVSDLYHLIEG
ncbi:hypothetical protein [Mitsuokella multacida]